MRFTNRNITYPVILNHSICEKVMRLRDFGVSIVESIEINPGACLELVSSPTLMTVGKSMYQHELPTSSKSIVGLSNVLLMKTCNFAS